MVVANPPQTLGVRGEHPAPAATSYKSSYTDEYIQLKQMMRDAGIFDKQPLYYIWKCAEVLLMFGITITVLYLTDNFWIQVLNGVWLGIASTHAGYLMHDAGHREIFRDAPRNDTFGWIFGNLLIGSAIGWWIPYHNEHHANPNELHTDPAIDLPFWAFDLQNAQEARGVMRWAIINQAYLYFPLMLVQGFFLRIRTANFFLTEKVRNKPIELFFIILHFIWYFWVIFSTQNILTGIAFIVVHHMVTGLYLGASFAPNHKGMPMVEAGAKMDFMLQQTITTRNVYPGPFNDWFFGGLNYQVEHHLFPLTPRNRLGKARRIIKPFCEEHGIPYHEVRFFESYAELLGEMHEIGQTAKKVKFV